MNKIHRREIGVLQLAREIPMFTRVCCVDAQISCSMAFSLLNSARTVKRILYAGINRLPINPVITNNQNGEI
jgi:hypothetical protein